MSQQSLQMGNSPAPAAAAAQQAAEAAALKAGEGVQITSTVVNPDGTKTTDFSHTPGQQPPAQPQGEPLILGKFKSQADLEAAYKALESKLGQPQQPQTQTPQQPPQGQQSVFDKAAAEFAADGKIADETLASLEAAGVPRATVDNYVAGVVALAAQQEQAAFGLVGGEQTYGQMVEWASSNLSDAEIAAFDAAVTNPATSEMAIKGLYARFQQSGTFEPTGGVKTGQPSAGDMFRSRHEMIAAMQDERYTKGDAAYHADVQAKIANAMRAGINVFA